jgi:hypothetical protein
MNPTPGPGWLNFDFHGIVGVRVHAEAPTALQLKTMMGSFAVDREVPPDIVVSGEREPMFDAAVLEDELAYTPSGVDFRRQHVQVVHEGTRYRVNGPGELLTAVLPILDLAMVGRGTAMIHAATVGYRDRAIAIPAGGGTGKTSTIAKLMRRPGFSFMGDDWAFVSADGRLLNYEKPMFIKPHHRPIYPHLFRGARKPLVPTMLSRPVHRVTSAVHPHIVKYPRLADMTRRMSPEHRTVTAQHALPDVSVSREAPLLMSIFVERYEGARTRVAVRDTEWMVERIVGNFNFEMPRFSRDVLVGLAATSHLSLGPFLEEKARILRQALARGPSYVVRVPSLYSADVASDDIVGVIEQLLVGAGHTPPGVSVA